MKHISKILLVLLLISCSQEDQDYPQEKECECKLKTTTVETITVNGVLQTRVRHAYEPYINDCKLDGFKPKENQVVECK